MTTSTATSIKPFTISVPQADLDDVADRLARTRFTQAIDDDASTHGIAVNRVKHLVEYWQHSYDWRAWERRLNSYPQFTTEIDGTNIWFLHILSDREDALPLILTHGWPGSVVEFLDLIEPLTEAGFHLVIPSMPGYGFSGPTTESGWNNNRIAAAWVELMRRLGYERYGAAGNDGGSMISPEVGRLDPEHVVGVHVSQVFAFPSGDPAELQDLSEDEQQALQTLTWFWEEAGAFNMLQSQQPQTLAHAIEDSPAGLVGWNSQLLGEPLDDEFVITNIAIYWFTATAGSSMRLYYENNKLMKEGATGAEPTTVPLGLAGSVNDFFGIRRFADRDHSNIVSWNVYDTQTHYLAHEEPELLAKDVVGFYSGLR
ncbi:MAG: epoxide hydrolase 1 [Actinomycetia bacterium]|nr:epoxide hydrolase 1 [Actinomycetes bacterium]